MCWPIWEEKIHKSELRLIVEAGEKLAAEGISVRLVSFPSGELFNQQSQAYQTQVLPDHIRARLAVEAGISLGWERWLGPSGVFIGMDGFGRSGPYQQVFQHFGITVERVVEECRHRISCRPDHGPPSGVWNA